MVGTIGYKTRRMPIVTCEVFKADILSTCQKQPGYFNRYACSPSANVTSLPEYQLVQTQRSDFDTKASQHSADSAEGSRTRAMEDITRIPPTNMNRIRLIHRGIIRRRSAGGATYRSDRRRRLDVIDLHAARRPSRSVSYTWPAQVPVHVTWFSPIYHMHSDLL